MTISEIPDHSLRIHADRGGTFCDIHASYPSQDGSSREELVVKLLSQDPGNYPDAPTEGIRRVLEKVTGQTIPRRQKLKTNKIDYIRLSTTLATNALLERRGTKHALLITKGFRDLLLIGNQSRPRIFDLNIRRPSPLYDSVVEIDERVSLVGYTSDPLYEDHRVKFDENGSVVKHYQGDEGGTIVRGISGEAVRVLRKPAPEAIRQTLRVLKEKGYQSLAIVFLHSYTFPEHEELVGRIAKEEFGFQYVSQSSQVGSMIKIVPRGTSTTADAYLTPILQTYLNGFFNGFEFEESRKSRVEFMTSDGGLVDARRFSGLKSILSGPAGGVVGYALTSYDPEDKRGVIGLDVGGTSTDVSRYAGSYETTQESTTAGVMVQSQQLDVNTVAAGGGSCLTFRSGLCRAGPESAGAFPGPKCYRKDGPLALTDANLLLGRLIPEYFPKIFGENEKEGLDIEASRTAFAQLVDDVNHGQHDGQKLSFDEVVYGFVKVANETMCRPIRALTEARGYATGSHILASFGGAGGQHACEIAGLLGIRTILIHRYSSVLSAYGLALADRAFELTEPCSSMYTKETKIELEERLGHLEGKVRLSLKEQGFEDSKINVARMLNMRFDGTDTTLMVQTQEGEDYEDAFKRMYTEEFGFLLERNRVVVDDVKVRGTGKTWSTLGPSVFSELKSSSFQIKPVPKESVSLKRSVYFDKIGRVEDVGIFELNRLQVGERVDGPAMIIDNTQTIVVVPGWNAIVTTRHLVIERNE